MSGRWLLLHAAIGAGWWLAALPALAQSPEDVEIIDVRVGFEGTYKVGCWTQLEATLIGGVEPQTGLLQVTVTDSDGVPTEFISPPDRPVGVDPTSPTTTRLLVRCGQTGGRYRVRFINSAGKVKGEQEFFSGPEASDRVLRTGLPSVAKLVVALGPAVGLGELARSPNQAVDESAVNHIAQLSNVSQLPVEWFGYEGVETVILSTSEPEMYRALTADSEQVAALTRWVELGGHVVLFCASSAAELIGSDGPLADLAPGNMAEMATLRSSTALQTFAGSEELINRGRINLRVPKLTDVRGQILAYEGQQPTDLPLVVRTRRGLGRITFAALDPEKPPLSDWSGRVSFLRRVIDWPAPTVAQQVQQDNVLTGQGFEDLTAQLRSALDDKFVGVKTAPFALVALLVIGYIALIGPGDYFFVKRVLKRMELTWVTFPLCVVAVSTAAYFLAFAMKGDQLRVNQVEVVDVDVESGAIRGTVWTHFFSPRVNAYDLSLQPRFAGNSPSGNAQTLVAWLGLPGSGLGGMQSGAAPASRFDRGYSFSPRLDAMRGMPVQEWSTKTLTARWTGDVDQSLQATLQPDADELLTGEILNQTGIDLDDCLLMYGRWAYRLNKLENGETAVIDRSQQPRTVKTQLTSGRAGDQATADTADDGTVQFDIYGSDVSRLVKLMMFYRAAGGRTYAPTWNRYQHFVDMSPLLSGRQAVLLARVDRNVRSQWIDGETPLKSEYDRNWTFYRFVIPIKEVREVTVPAQP